MPERCILAMIQAEWSVHRIPQRIRKFMKKGGLEVSTIMHPGGHSVPVKNDMALHSIIDWMKDS